MVLGEASVDPNLRFSSRPCAYFHMFSVVGTQCIVSVSLWAGLVLVLVRVYIDLKRHHDYDSFYKENI